MNSSDFLNVVGLTALSGTYNVGKSKEVGVHGQN